MNDPAGLATHGRDLGEAEGAAVEDAHWNMHLPHGVSFAIASGGIGPSGRRNVFSCS